jgi:hypothetical protein
MRFWTGRHVIEDTSVCYRSAWESTHPGEPLATYIPENPNVGSRADPVPLPDGLPPKPVEMNRLG